MKFNTKCMKSLHKLVTRCRLTFNGFVRRMISVITITVVSKNIPRLGDAQIQRRYYFTPGRGAKHCHELVRGVTTAGDRGDASPVRPTMSPLHQSDNRHQFVFGADF